MGDLHALDPHSGHEDPPPLSELSDLDLLDNPCEADDSSGSVPSPDNASNRKQPVKVSQIVTMSDVAPEHVSWLWRGRIPLSKMTMLDGDPGLGKSTLTLDWAARVSTGAPFPGSTERRLPAGTLLLGAEDGLADTVRPRLEAANADASRIHVMVAVRTKPNGDRCPYERLPQVPTDLPLIAEEAIRLDVKLIVIDPVMAYLDPDVESFKDHHIRRALSPLGRMAEATGAAVVLVRHLNKGDGSALYRGGGSIGLIGAVRCGMIVGKDPDDPDRGRVLAPTKNNIAAPQPAIRYRLVSTANGVARVEWGETCHLDADALLSVPKSADDASALDEAVDFLNDLLTHQSITAREMKRLAKDAGISDSTLKRAKRRVGVVSHKAGFGTGATWFWTKGAISSGGETLAPFASPNDSTFEQQQYLPLDSHEGGQDHEGGQGNPPREDWHPSLDPFMERGEL